MRLLLLILAVGGSVELRSWRGYDGPPIYVMGPEPLETRQTCVRGCAKHRGTLAHCCPGVMSEACCEKWASGGGERPACAGGDAGVPVS